jgi:hypothetical protein
MPYDVATVNIFSPADAGVEITGDQIRSGGPFMAQGATLDTYAADALSAGDILKLRLSGESEVPSRTTGSSPHQTAGPSNTQSIALGLLVLAGAVAISFLYLRGGLNQRLRPTGPDAQSTLLQAIADLDDEYEDGRVKEKAYHTRRAKLKEQLIELMESEE